MADHSHVRTRLLKDYPADAQGTWQILGEDPNCDFGGPHHEPELEVVTGTYKNVVEYALTLPRFFNWGGGGRIKLMTPPKGLVNVDTLKSPEVLKLEEERKQLQDRLRTIESDLKSIVQAPPKEQTSPKELSKKKSSRSPQRYRD